MRAPRTMVEFCRVRGHNVGCCFQFDRRFHGPSRPLLRLKLQRDFTFMRRRPVPASPGGERCRPGSASRSWRAPAPCQSCAPTARRALLRPQEGTRGHKRRGPAPPHQLSRKLLRILDRLGCFSFLSALASICLKRSRVNENCWPTTASVFSVCMPMPKRMRRTAVGRSIGDQARTIRIPVHMMDAIFPVVLKLRNEPR
jgi:hypothetical protein